MKGGSQKVDSRKDASSHCHPFIPLTCPSTPESMKGRSSLLVLGILGAKVDIEPLPRKNSPSSSHKPRIITGHIQLLNSVSIQICSMACMNYISSPALPAELPN